MTDGKCMAAISDTQSENASWKPSYSGNSAFSLRHAEDAEDEGVADLVGDDVEVER